MRRGHVISVAAVVATLASIGTAAPAMADTIVVNPGESIQAALDAAPPGSTIVVRAGTYAENIEIVKDGVTLRGAGVRRTILVPPAAPLQRFCTPDPNDPFVVGICATGEVNFETGGVVKLLNGTRITGFSVRGFPADGILLVAVADGVVEANEASGNSRGIDAFNSTRSLIRGNLVKGNTRSGIRVEKFALDNPELLPPADATVTGNVTTGNTGPGIVVFDADKGQIRANSSVGNCGGILFVTLFGDTRDWNVEFNVVAKNNLVCPPAAGPPLAGLGIGVLGAAEIRISHNVITGNVVGGPTVLGGGVAVSTEPFNSSAPSEIEVSANVVQNNQPTDLSWDGTGTGIGFTNNVCGSSAPPGLC